MRLRHPDPERDAWRHYLAVREARLARYRVCVVLLAVAVGALLSIVVRLALDRRSPDAPSAARSAAAELI